MTATWVRRLPRMLAAVAVVVWAGLAQASPADAHNVLRSTSPADHATVAQLPAQVVLTFDQPALAVGTQISVTGPSGPVDAGPAQLVDTEVRQPLKPGPVGSYTVLWRATSADGHPVSGTFTFTTSSNSDASTTSSPLPSTPAASVEARAPSQATSGGLPGLLGPVLVAAVLLVAAALVLYRRRRRPPS